MGPVKNCAKIARNFVWWWIVTCMVNRFWNVLRNFFGCNKRQGGQRKRERYRKRVSEHSIRSNPDRWTLNIYSEKSIQIQAISLSFRSIEHDLYPPMRKITISTLSTQQQASETAIPMVCTTEHLYIYIEIASKGDLTSYKFELTFLKHALLSLSLPGSLFLCFSLCLCWNIFPFISCSVLVVIYQHVVKWLPLSDFHSIVHVPFCCGPFCFIWFFLPLFSMSLLLSLLWNFVSKMKIHVAKIISKSSHFGFIRNCHWGSNLIRKIIRLI